jgi:NADH-quinone oxidoreductase subunit A
MPGVPQHGPEKEVGLASMPSAGPSAYLPLVIHLLVASFLAGVLILISTFIGWRRPSKTKQQPYECGITPTGDARQPFSVKYYLVAIVFILFDVEAIFLYPWALIFKDMARVAATRWYYLHHHDALLGRAGGRIYIFVEEGCIGLEQARQVTPFLESVNRQPSARSATEERVYQNSEIFFFR